MTDLQRSLLSLSVEGFARSAPSQKQLDESLVYSEEGAKGAILGFLTGQLAYVGLGFTVGGIWEQEIEMKKKQILHITKQLQALQNDDVDKATRIGIKEGNRSIREKAKKLDQWQILKMALVGTVFAPISATLQGSKFEDLQVELAEKLTELKVAYAKRNINIDEE